MLSAQIVVLKSVIGKQCAEGAVVTITAALAAVLLLVLSYSSALSLACICSLDDALFDLFVVTMFGHQQPLTLLPRSEQHQHHFSSRFSLLLYTIVWWLLLVGIFVFAPDSPQKVAAAAAPCTLMHKKRGRQRVAMFVIFMDDKHISGQRDMTMMSVQKSRLALLRHTNAASAVAAAGPTAASSAS